MKHEEAKVKDPVCGMLVDREQLSLEFMQMHFAFCSEQCRERFLATPGLYIGHPGQKAPVQEGLYVIRRRRLHLAEPLPSGMAKALADSLQTMMGVQAVSVNDDVLEITYDLLQATAEQIEGAIGEFGDARLGEAWRDRFLRAWIHVEEETIISGMEVPHSGGLGKSSH